MDYTKRRNVNRGYMKLECWQRAVDLFVLAFGMSSKMPDLKMRSQFRDSAQSVSANIAEGYGRRTLPEYLQFLSTAKGSLGEALTRAIGIRAVEVISQDLFEQFDQLHYEVENKLLRLIESLERKKLSNDWSDTIPPRRSGKSINPLIQTSEESRARKSPTALTNPSHQSGNPPIHRSTNPPAV